MHSAIYNIIAIFERANALRLYYLVLSVKELANFQMLAIYQMDDSSLCHIFKSFNVPSLEHGSQSQVKWEQQWK